MTATQVREVPAGGRLQLGFVEGLRGLSALFVVLHHVWQFSIADPEAPSPSWFRVASVFKYGSFAVAVFLVVSGFCLMLPVVRCEGQTLPGGVSGFAQRRALRILPPYYAALGFSLLLIAAFSELRTGSGTPWDITLPNFTFDQVVSHLFLFHNWFDDLRWGLDPPLWTVALEFQIYFAFALVLLPCWRRFNAATTVALGFVVGLGLTVLGAGRVSPWMVGLFALGMVAAALGVGTVNRPGRWARLPWSRIAIAFAVLVPVATAALSKLDVGIAAPFAEETIVGLATTAGLIAMSQRHLHRPTQPTRVMSGLEAPPVRFLGTVSYSLYLVHYPIVAVVALTVVGGHDLSVPSRFGALLAVCVPLSVAAAYGFYRVFERPYLARRARAPEPHRVAPATA